MVRMKDVAKHAGVSVATVSNVIAGKKSVNEEIRRNVLASIEELNYHINTMARGLKTQQTYTIGVILPDITRLFFTDLLKGVIDKTYAAGYRINVLSSNYDFTTEKALVNFLLGNQVDGIIIGSCVHWKKAGEWAEQIMNNNGKQIPVVSVEGMLHKSLFSSVCIDSEYYGGYITQHLIDIGRKKILYVSGPNTLIQERERYQGYCNTLERNGIELNASLKTNGNYLSETAYNAVLKALDDGVEFDAVQATNDQSAVGVLKALMERGIRVPEDVALCGFDDLFPGTLVQPAITTVHVPRYEMGETAAQEVLRRIEDKNADPINYILNGRLVVRKSSCADVETSWSLEKW